MEWYVLKYTFENVHTEHLQIRKQLLFEKKNKLQDQKYVLWPVIKNINDLTFSSKSEKLNV